MFELKRKMLFPMVVDRKRFMLRTPDLYTSLDPATDSMISVCTDLAYFPRIRCRGLVALRRQRREKTA